MFVAERVSSILDALKWSMMFIAKLGVDSLLRCPTGFEPKTCVIMIIIHSRKQQLCVIACYIGQEKSHPLSFLSTKGTQQSIHLLQKGFDNNYVTSPILLVVAPSGLLATIIIKTSLQVLIHRALPIIIITYTNVHLTWISTEGLTVEFCQFHPQW